MYLHSQLHDDGSKSLPDVFVLPVLCGKFCDMMSLFLGISGRTAVQVLGNIE